MSAIRCAQGSALHNGGHGGPPYWSCPKPEKIFLASVSEFQLGASLVLSFGHQSTRRFWARPSSVALVATK